jgi:phospholipase C
MDGFLAADGPGALAYFTDDDHPYYSWLLTTFATSDRYFCSALAGTWTNRAYLYCGTSDGIRFTGLGGPPSTPSVFDQLDHAGVSWHDYVDMSASNEPLEGVLQWTYSHANVQDLPQFFDALDHGTLPSVSFVDSIENVTDEHPPANIHAGEAFVRNIVDHAFHSPQWGHLVIFYTYDEGGGFFDHVAPPSACIAAANESDVDHLGFRVPIGVISPWTRPGYVSHDVHSHTSILRFIQAIFDLPALTVRDANSDAMMDFFDFRCPSFATPPANAPAAAQGGC